MEAQLVQQQITYSTRRNTRPTIDIDTQLTFQPKNEAILQAEMLAQLDRTFHVPFHARALRAGQLQHMLLSLGVLGLLFEGSKSTDNPFFYFVTSALVVHEPKVGAKRLRRRFKHSQEHIFNSCLDRGSCDERVIITLDLLNLSVRRLRWATSNPAETQSKICTILVPRAPSRKVTRK